MTTTYEGYLVAVKKQYEVAKNGMYSSFLLHPSPAQLRNLCLLLLENNVSKADEEIFKLFFQPPGGDGLRKSIGNFDIEKFKAIVNFLKGKSDWTNMVSLNLIAVLVDFQPRPYAKYLRTNFSDTAKDEIQTKKGIQRIEPIALVPTKPTSVGDHLNMEIFKKGAIGVGMLLVLIFGVSLINQSFFNQKQCMQWQNDHYEAVDCSVAQQGIITQNEVIPINNSVVNLRKIDVNEQTQFFKNGKPLVWYAKHKGKLSYFNSYGINPETGKALKPMTKYMIDKYVFKGRLSDKN